MQPLLAFALVALSITGCAQPAKHLDHAKRQACLAEGGYESRGAFGHPICQFDYADAGHDCSDKSDCQGRCLLMLEGPSRAVPQPGEAARGMCEAKRYTPGCYAEVEDGKISINGAYCLD